MNVWSSTAAAVNQQMTITTGTILLIVFLTTLQTPQCMLLTGIVMNSMQVQSVNAQQHSKINP